MVSAHGFPVAVQVLADIDALPARPVFAPRGGMTLSKIVCGIDFGTSNSAIAIAREGVTDLVPVEGAHTTIPSAIFFPAKGDKPLYGRAAVDAYAIHEPGRLLRSLKSILGSELIAEKTAVGGQYQSFEDILVGYVKHLKGKAEAVRTLTAAPWNTSS